jgi:hypothetical protein
VDVHEVRLAFVATDQHNQDVPTLTPADIAVVDNGTVIRHFRSLSRDPQVNLEALVLIDASESLARRFSQEIAEAAQLIAEARWGADDVLSVMPRFDARSLGFEDSREGADAVIRCRVSWRGVSVEKSRPKIPARVDHPLRW